MTRLRGLVNRLVGREDAQATTEYILLVAIAVFLVLLVLKKVVLPVITAIKTNLGKKIDQSIFGADMHKLKIHR